MNRIIITLVLSAFAVLAAGCSVTIKPGTLNVGAQATFATNKSQPVCSNTESRNWYGKSSSSSVSWNCTQVYDLGDLRCVRSWTENRSEYNAPGKRNDSSSMSVSNSPPSCRPMTPAEKAERDEQLRRAAEAAKMKK
jgi:hypothetical protein